MFRKQKTLTCNVLNTLQLENIKLKYLSFEVQAVIADG